jgi:hypothetical protein
MQHITYYLFDTLTSSQWDDTIFASYCDDMIFPSHCDGMIFYSQCNEETVFITIIHG